MSLAYSRISLSEVAHRSWRSTTSRERGHRHGESSSRDRRAKAIRDGVLDATIVHRPRPTGTLVSKEQVGGSKEV